MLTSKETITAISEAAVTKSSLPWLKMLILAILAGAYIGFGAHLSTVVTTDLTARAGYGITRYVAGISFSLGLVLVVVAGAELFTGNVLMLSSLASGKIKLSGLLRNWSLVYLGNALGSILLAGLIFGSGVNGIGQLTPVGTGALVIAQAKTSLPISQIFFRAILANWLVCLAVYLATSAKSLPGKVLGCLLPISAFVAMSFEHSIANMYFLSIGGMLAASSGVSLTLAGCVTNIIVATLGNIMGAGLFVALPYWRVHLKN